MALPPPLSISPHLWEEILDPCRNDTHIQDSLQDFVGSLNHRDWKEIELPHQTGAGLEARVEVSAAGDQAVRAHFQGMRPEG